MNTPELPFQPWAMQPTGSAYMCNPPVSDTDEDWLVLSRSPLALPELESMLKQHGWSRCGEDEKENYAEDQGYGNTWIGLRKGRFNLMLTESYDWYMRACAATMLCKQMNLQVKEHRKHVFRAIRDAEAFDPQLIPPLGSASAEL